jgi:hypothetical protein
MRVHLTKGSSSIEIDGTLAEVTTILDTYWVSVSAHAAHEQAQPTVPDGERPASKSRKRPKRSPSAAKNGAATTASSDDFDGQAVANKMKGHELFGRMQQKALNQKSKWIEKGKCVCLMVEEPLHTGQIRKVLLALKLQAPAPRLSEAFSRNNADFLVKGVNPAFYELTAPARAAFEDWLRKDGND